MVMKSTKNLLDFWEDQMRQSHRSSNYFFRKSPSHYHMMLLIMAYHKQNLPITVEELKTKLFKTSRPKSALIINEACEKGFFYLEKAQDDQRKKNIKPTESFVNEFEDYLKKLKEKSLEPVFFMAAETPAIDVIIASLRYFLSLDFIFFFDIFLITIA